MPRKKGRIPGRVASTRVVLDVFTEQDIERWSARSEDGQLYSDRVYFDLERQRAEHHEKLCNALRAVDPIEVNLESGKGLREFARIIGGFRLSPDTLRFARKVNLKPRRLIRNARELLTRVLAAPDAWRTEPYLFGIPAANQILGRFIRDAGFDAVLYPSQQGGTLCLAVFPQNIRNSSSRVEVVGAAPEGARFLVLDKDSANLDSMN